MPPTPPRVSPPSASFDRRRLPGPALRLLLALASTLTLLAACDDSTGGAVSEAAGDVPAATEATPATMATTPAGAAPGASAPAPGASAAGATPQVERAMEHIRRLAVEIGPRAAGSAEERAAAEYIATVLRDAGYETAIEPFSFQAERDDSLVTLADGSPVRALSMRGAANGEVTGVTVHGGLGEAADLAGADFSGKVVVFDRGVIPFGEKALAAVAGGAVAAVVVNSEPGLFLGSLGDAAVDIPVLAVAGEDRDALVAALGERITVRADAGMVATESQNVIGRRGDQCRGYLGAHYDSVGISAGANDNASGTAVVLELARANPVDGLCIVLFGAEEVGLFGSQQYVADHLAGTARFMLNVDMAGRLDGPSIIGDDDLTARILEAITAAGVESPLRPGEFPPFASSDHVSFAAVGVPAVTFNAGDDEAIHTPDDTIERIQTEAVGLFLRALDAALDALVTEFATR